MPDLNKLKGIMVENGKTYVDGARVIGCSVTSFSAGRVTLRCSKPMS